MPKNAQATAALIALASFTYAIGSGRPAYAASFVQAFSWTGCYVGAAAGSVWASSEKWIVRTPGGDFPGQSLGGHDMSDWIGGVQGGCDYQFASRLVIGVQGDYGWTDAKGSHPSALETGVAYHSGVDSLASLTGRIGYAWGRLLGYVKGGVAWERADYSASTILVGTAYTSSDTRSGWTVGAGGDYAITKFLSGFVEYNHYDFGTADIRLTPQIVGLPTGFLDIEDSANVVRAGLNLRFGG